MAQTNLFLVETEIFYEFLKHGLSAPCCLFVCPNQDIWREFKIATRIIIELTHVSSYLKKLPLNKTYPWTRTFTFAGFHGTRNVDCFNSLLWFCFVWRAVEKTLRLRLISTCTDPVLALNFPLHLSVSRIKTASQLLHLQENTEVLASVNEQNMTGRLTD